MPKPYRYLLVATLITLAAFLYLRESEEEKILAMLAQIRGLAEINELESGLIQASRAREIAQFFAEHTIFDFTNAGYRIYEIGARQELTQKILKGRAALSLLELGLQNPKISINTNAAKVEAIGSALGSVRNQEGQFLERHQIEVLLKKQESGWIVTGARHIRNERQLSHP